LVAVLLLIAWHALLEKPATPEVWQRLLKPTSYARQAFTVHQLLKKSLATKGTTALRDPPHR